MKLQNMNRFDFWVNDRLVEVTGLPSTTTLLDFLREELRLTGTKEGCDEGDCGACTIVYLDPDAACGPKYRAVNACLVLLPMMRGRRVYTVEALADGDKLHPAQQALVDRLGSQCGFCTPGVVMSMFEATYRKDLDADWKLDSQMCGNICRCTGYRPIREAAQQIAGKRPNDRFMKALEEATPTEFADPRGAYETETGKYFAPTTFDALFEILSENPSARFVTGGTDVGLLVTKEHQDLPCLISLEALPEMRRVEDTETSLLIGGSLPLSDIEDFAGSRIAPLTRMLRYFAGRQIKHRGTIGGSICNASPVGDVAPVLLALGATCIARSAKGARRIPIDEFFIGYRKTALAPGEILEAVEIPWIPKDARASSYKISKRRELNISAVAASFFVRTDSAGKVTEARLAYGGMAALPTRAPRAEDALVGKPWSEETVEKASAKLSDDMKPIDDLRAGAWYRATVAANLLRGFFLETKEERVPMISDFPSGTVEPIPADAKSTASKGEKR